MVWLEAGPELTIKGGARGAPRSGAGRRAPGGGAAPDSRARASSGGFRTDSPRPARRRRRPSLAAGRGRRAVPGALGARAAPPPRRRDERGERPPGPVAPGPAARGDAGVAGPRGRGEGAGQRPEGEASSGRCGWRLAGAAAPGEESPPRDAVGVRRGPGLPGSAHCIQRGVRPASPTRQHLVSRRARRGCPVVAPGPPRRCPRGADPPPRCSWRPGPSSGSAVSLPASAVLFAQTPARAGVEAHLARLLPRLAAPEDTGLGPVFPPGRTGPGQQRRGLAPCDPSAGPGVSRPSPSSAVGQVPARDSHRGHGGARAVPGPSGHPVCWLLFSPFLLLF